MFGVDDSIYVCATAGGIITRVALYLGVGTVADEWRRDPNETRIQPNPEDAGKSSTHINQPKDTHHVPHLSTLVVSELLVVAVFIIVPLSVQAGLFDFFGNKDVSIKEAQVATVATALDINLLAASHNPSPLGARGGAEIVVENDALVSSGPVGEDDIAELSVNSGEIRVYTVREGDSLSQIAEMFGVTTNTIMWANDISRATAIQPGDTLVILPIVGVRHVVKDGDTIGKIASKYEGDADEILEYNELASADELSVGDTIIIPGGSMHSTVVSSVASAQPVRSSGSVSGAGLSHPAPGAVKTQGIHGYNAVDLAAGYGSPIRAAAAGEVIVSKSSGWNGGYGQYVVIRHPNGTQTLYAHLMRNDVGVGAYVSQGQVIGGMGSTGKSTGTHLHFEVRGGSNPF
jgi:LysM repeat protein